MALFRRVDDLPFDGADVEFARSLSTAFGVGLRAGVLAHLVAADLPNAPHGPSVIMVGADDAVRQLSVGAEQRLAALTHGPHSSSPTNVLSALVAGARAYRAGHTDTLPRGRLRTGDGRWCVVHASPLSGGAGDVVVTIEHARPPELIARVFVDQYAPRFGGVLGPTGWFATGSSQPR